MPRRNAVRRAGAGEKVVIVIDSVQHTLTIPAFIELMQMGHRVLVSLETEMVRLQKERHT